MREESQPGGSIGQQGRPGVGDRVSELRADLTLLQSQLYGPGNESLFVRLRLQEELNKELDRWKRTLLARFWQVVLVLVTTFSISTASVWWEQSGKIVVPQQQISILEKRLP